MGFELMDPDTGLPVLVKQPAESREYSMDFANLLLGASIAEVTLTTVVSMDKEPGSQLVALGGATVDRSRVKTRISGGTHGENYKLTVRVTDTGGNTLEGDGMLYVREM